MSNLETIEQELRQYLQDSPNLLPEDRFKYLMAIFNKHFGMEKLDHMLTSQDLHDIVSYAKGQYPKTTLPMKIGKKEVYGSEVPHVLMIEAVISHLNRFKLLKKLVRFDYR